MAEVPLALLPHRVAVDTYTGDGSEGPTYRPRLEGIRCNQQGEMVVDADGEHVGSVKLYLRLEHAPRFALGSVVHLAGGGTVVVKATAEHRDGGLGAWQHLEVSAE